MNKKVGSPPQTAAHERMRRRFVMVFYIALVVRLAGAFSLALDSAGGARAVMATYYPFVSLLILVADGARGASGVLPLVPVVGAVAYSVVLGLLAVRFGRSRSDTPTRPPRMPRIVFFGSAACLLLAVALPIAIRARMTEPCKDSCINLLRQLEGAKEQWKLELKKSSNEIPTWDDLRPYLKRTNTQCPDGGTYTIGSLEELATCSIARHTEFWRQAHP